MRVRPLAPADLPIVREWMRDDAEAPRWSDADLDALCREPTVLSGRVRRAWAAFDGQGQLCGFGVAAAVLSPGMQQECELEFLFTAPARRRSGVGRLLLGTIIGWCEQLDADQLLLEVRRSNEAAQQLYREAGFAPGGVRAGYYQHPAEDAVLMRLALVRPPGDAPV